MARARILWLTPVLIAFHSAAGQQTCHAADVNSAHFIQTLKAVMDTSHSVLRAKLNLPLVSPSQITLVTDPAICARAGLAADSIFKVWEPTATLDPTTDPIYVITIGTSFAVADLNNPDDSSFDWVFVFGPLWEYRGGIGM